MITNIHFYPLNGYDNLHLTVDKMSKRVIFKKEKWLNDNERLYCTIYDDGIALYGLEMQSDPAHGNQKYTWSSNAQAINRELELIGTSMQLATHNIGIKEMESPYSCYFSCGYLLDNMMKIAIANEGDLKYGFLDFYRRQSGKPFTKVTPHKGLKLGNKYIDVLGSRYIETNEGWLECLEVSDYVLEKTGCWSLGDWLGKELI